MKRRPQIWEKERTLSTAKENVTKKDLTLKPAEILLFVFANVEHLRFN